MSGELHVQNLGKSYRQWGNELRRVASWFAPFIRPREEHWVLKDVSFSVGPGEAVGIVGQNGAGKSTLLKLITGTTSPTQGQVQLHGSVAAILELGMGFNPDLTGRENAFHAAGLMGYSQADIKRAMPDIEAFTEVGEYFDQPVRTYSSGMQMRLAFSVATAKRPDILIVDEALAVGDASFQHKCYALIRQFKQLGTTLLFVSHDALTIKSLCNRAILLDSHCVVMDASPDTVLDYYNSLLTKHEIKTVSPVSIISKLDSNLSIPPEINMDSGQSNVTVALESDKNASQETTISRSGNRKAHINSVAMIKNGQESREIRSGDPVRIQVLYQVNEVLPELTVGIMLRDKLGNDIFGTNTHILGISCPGSDTVGEKSLNFNFKNLSLGVGNYSLTVALHAGCSRLQEDYDWWDRVIVFDVLPNAGPVSAGCCVLPVTIDF